MNAVIDWHARSQSLKLPTEILIDGKFCGAQSGKTYEVVNPATGRAVARLPDCGAADVDRAVAAARRSFESGVWSGLAPRERKKVLKKLSELIDAHREELALMDSISMGMPIAIASGYCVQWAVNCFEWYGEAIDKIYDEVAPTDRGVFATITREPVGVVGAVLPWNWPTGLLGWKVPPALATGNSVVLKPDEQTSLSALKIAALALEAGLPPGVFNVVTGGPVVGEAIGRHMDIDVVGFTGSTEVGKLFLKYAAESNMKPVWTECGGKSPNIVFADAPNLQEAAQESALAIFLNTGQICAAGSRLIVEESVKDQVLEIISAVGQSLKPSDPLRGDTMLGPIAKASQLERVMSYIAIGAKEGAKLRIGGSRVNEASGGFFVEPTVFDRVDNSMRIAQEEIFGPVLSTISFRSVEEAIALANKTTYGLASAVWTGSLSKAHKVSRAIRAGAVSVNCYAADAHDVTVPFGGYKQSGFGRDKSLHALDKYVQLKTTWMKL
ncbi:MAG: aldehyde dehydrogenase [Gammaproteobacteria bacterium]|nr:aldehyde dehydrogenase [Gammaproteobacteria bacterium]